MEQIGQTLAGYPSTGNIPGPKIYNEEVEETPAEHRARNLHSLGTMDLAHTFENIKTPAGFEPTLAAFRTIATGQADFSMLMVYGGVGNGKSYICEATVIDMYDRGLWVLRDRWSDVVRALKAHFSGHYRDSGGLSIPYEVYFNKLRARARLILDDVGSGSTLGSWEWGELEDIVDYRYERRLFTIITTNLDIKQFPERILSRFRDKSRSRLICNQATDQRPLLYWGESK